MSTPRLNLLALVLTLSLISACSMAPPIRAASEAPGAAVCQPDADRGFPAFENRFETEHFILKWTNKSPHAADNLSDPEIVKETAGYFEIAWKKYRKVFGKTPYTPPGRSKITVIFRDLDCYAYADPPSGPIELNSLVWTKIPSIRKPTSAHELFHKLQYAYGYKTRWVPPHRPYLWFTEGTAAWAEVFVWGRVSRDCKMEDMFKNCHLDLYHAEDMALPFWIYFVSGNHKTPRNDLMVKFFRRYEKTGKVKQSLFDVIRESHGSVDDFFARFAAERQKGFWGKPGPDCSPYTCIVGPDGKDLVKEIENRQCQEKSNS